MNTTQDNKQKPCGFVRRLAAIFYDSLLLLAVFFVATFLLILFLGGEAIESGNLAYNLFLLMIAWIYFSWHWTKGRQTLGMRSWHIFLINDAEDDLGNKQATLRFIFSLLSIALAGLGFLWAIIDKDKLALHDHLSHTRLIIRKL